ncbi:MAG: twin-arginine translocation signal domain-containing protein, partial [Akkermansiaceae bacterium]
MNTDTNTRRKFLKTIGAAGAGLSAATAMAKPDTPTRLTGAKYMGDFIAPKL